MSRSIRIRSAERRALVCVAWVLADGAALSIASSARAQPRYEARVTARPVETPREDRAADASVITEDRTPRSGESMAQILGELPGVTVNRLGGIGATATISLRGSTWEQVGVYIDGIPLNTGIGGGVDLSTLPIGDVARIEVYRGSTPIGFGASALGGILSITTRAASRNGVSAEVGYGSFSTATLGATGSLVTRRVRLYVGAHVLSSAGNFLYTTDNGTAFNPDSQREVERANNGVAQIDGVARATFPLTPGRDLTVEALFFVRDKQLPGYGSLRQTRQTALDTQRFLGAIAYDSVRDLGGDSRLRAQLYYSIGRQRFRDELSEIAVTPTNTDDRGYSLGATLRGSRSIGSFLRLSAILDERYEEFSPFDEKRQPPQGAPSRRLFGSAGLEADFTWKRLRLHVIPSVRIEAAYDVRSGRNKFGELLEEAPPVRNTLPSGRLALVEEAARFLTLRANAGRYARLPSMTELFGNNGFLLGNAKLLPETGWNVDAGAQLRIGRSELRASAEATFFGSFVDDLIQLQQDAYGRASAVNLGRARIFGVEGSVSARLSPFARLQIDGTFTDARDVSNTSLGERKPLLPLRPRYRLHARPEARLPVRGAVLLGAYVDLDFTDGNFIDPANLVALPRRILIGAGLYAEVPRAGLQILASGQNLGDARTFDYAGFPLQSRAFFFSIRGHFTQEPTS